MKLIWAGFFAVRGFLLSFAVSVLWGRAGFRPALQLMPLTIAFCRFLVSWSEMHGQWPISLAPTHGGSRLCQELRCLRGVPDETGPELTGSFRDAARCLLSGYRSVKRSAATGAKPICMSVCACVRDQLSWVTSAICWQPLFIQRGSTLAGPSRPSHMTSHFD